jgi:predicted CoA-binding protein
VSEDDKIRRVLSESKIVAVVGASPNPARDSHDVMAFLQARGYRAIPVNPVCEETEILGERVRRDLAEIDEPVDLVDVFRRSEHAGEVVDEAVHNGARRGAGRAGRDGPLPEDRDTAPLRLAPF